MEKEKKEKKEKLDVPVPQIKSRDLNKKIEQLCLSRGLHPLLARVVAARPLPAGLNSAELNIDDVLFSKLQNLDHPLAMADMSKAAKRVAKAIYNKECIGLETDHDCDGQTSHAVLYHNLVYHFKHPKELIKSYIGHRLKEGYGLSALVAKRILQDSPRSSLLITADNGSSDEPRIKKLVEVGIDVIITDHHQIPEDNYPNSAHAFLNPTRNDCKYNDKNIAGCMVAWLLMAAVRLQLIKDKYLGESAPRLIDSLDFVAVGTIADCVSIAKSKNNRAVVNYGMKLISQGVKPCWQVLLPLLNNPVSSQDLGFKIGPLLNSDGRLSSALGSVSFLLAKDYQEAQQWVDQLQAQNKERKAIQKEITTKGIEQAIRQFQAKKLSLCIYLSQGHAGVHGISASRVKDLFGRPTVFLAPKFEQPKLITGSIRGVDNFHVHEALQWINDKNSNLLISYGGHKGAAGVTFNIDNLQEFSELFEQATQIQLSEQSVGPIVWTDGFLPGKMINLDVVEILTALEPFGREFEEPVFQTEAVIRSLRLLGDGTHAKFALKIESENYVAIWFGMRRSSQDQLPVAVGDKVQCAFSLRTNLFAGVKSCELQIISMQQL